MRFEQLTRYRRSILTASVLSLATLGTARAADVTLDFTQDPSLGGQVTLFGNAQWRESGGNTGGYMAISDAVDSQRSAIVFSDLDNNLVVKAFSFSVDVRVGGGSATPADGFSINYVRAGDDVLDDGEGWSDIGNAGDLNLPEEGAKTGLAVGFDAYLSGGGTITDVIGMSVRVDNQLLAQYAFPTLNGALTDTTSLQTGPLNPDFDPAADPIEESWALLGWAKFEVALAEDGKLTIKYKGREVTPAGGLQTTFFPSPGQLVFAGRTGGENQNTHIDNIHVTTVPAELPFFTGLSGTAAGFTFQLSDGATQVVQDSVQVKLNGTAVTLTSLTKDGNTTTGVYAPATPLVAGSENTVEVTFRDTAGRTSTTTREFVVRDYTVLAASQAVPAASVDRTAPGFTARIHQMAIGRFPGDANSIRNAERHLANRYIDPATGQPYANVADLSGATAGVFTIPTVINWNQDVSTGGENIGSFQDDSDPARPDAAIPGIPGTTITNPDGSAYTDNIAAEILTYLELKRGLYRFGVNSDDGFRVTAGTDYRDIFATSFGSYNGGKGSSDEFFDVFVEADGVYPFRLAWWEGGGGANLEFFTLNEATGQKILINDTAVAGSVPAFRSSTAPTQPYVTYVAPAIDETGTFPNPTVVVDIRDGSVTLNDATVALTLNGATLASTVANNGTLTTVTAPITSLLPSGSTNTLVLTYQATGSSTPITETWTFVTSPVTTLPTTLVSPVGSGDSTKPGFTARIYQVEPWLDANGAATGMATELYWADALLAGAAGANVADLSAAENGLFLITNVVNFNGEATLSNAGAIPNDEQMPGIPGLGTQNTTDNIAGEFTTYVEFPTAGVYRMGVNSDDGFRLTASETRGNFLLNVLAPSAVAGPKAVVLSARGSGGQYGPLPSTPITADIIYGGGVGCGPLPNVSEVAGKILMLDRGTCGFVDKARNAQTNGALALIIVNSNPGFPIVAGGDGPDVTIPVVMIGQVAGDELKANQTGLRATLSQETAFVVSEANVGRGSAGSIFDGTLATFNVPEAGVYPFRLLWMEGGGGANVEWYSITPAGEGILINDRSNPRALKAYRARTSVDRPTLTVSRSATGITLTFTGSLQAATTVDGEYTTIATTSPVTLPTDLPFRFFQAVR